MKKLFAVVIPAVLITFIIVYSSCNDVPVDGTSVNNTEGVQQDENSTSGVEKGIQNGETIDNNSPGDPDNAGINMTEAIQPCGVGIGPSGTVTIPAGTQYTYNYSAWAGVIYSPTFSSRSLNIISDGGFVTVINNWTQGQCGSPAVTAWNNTGNGTISLNAGMHSICARLIYSCNVGGQPVNIDTTVCVTVNVIALTIPSTPSVTFSTIGQSPAKRPYLTWTASSPSITSYVIQRRYYPSGTFADYATVSGSTLSYTDNAINVITDRYDLEYYKVEYRVRAVNQIGSSGYQPPSYEWYSHGCNRHSLGYICADE